MIYSKLKYFFILSFIFSFQEIDSSLVSNFDIDKRFLLIPKYDNTESDFKIDFLGKRKNFFLDLSLGYVRNDAFRLNFSPLFRNPTVSFKINFDYFLNNNLSTYNNNWNNIFDLLERIEYFELSLFKNKLNLFLGNIKNKNLDMDIY